MSAVVDLRPACAAVCRAIVATDRTDLAAEVDGRVRLAGSRHPETDAVGKGQVGQLREAVATVGGVPYSACGGVRTDQPDIIGLVVNGYDLGRRGQACTDGRRKPRYLG